ncbi:hypothetical protein RUM44_013626 [Polyplax serrata]|uniref:Uncharacterized protein n=1 Tax=Polyplax serrata TaxID=468196 RepID=A0ABR1BEQ3_POLSC
MNRKNRSATLPFVDVFDNLRIIQSVIYCLEINVCKINGGNRKGQKKGQMRERAEKDTGRIGKDRLSSILQDPPGSPRV